MADTYMVFEWLCVYAFVVLVNRLPWLLFSPHIQLFFTVLQLLSPVISYGVLISQCKRGRKMCVFQPVFSWISESQVHNKAWILLRAPATQWGCVLALINIHMWQVLLSREKAQRDRTGCRDERFDKFIQPLCTYSTRNQIQSVQRTDKELFKAYYIFNVLVLTSFNEHSLPIKIMWNQFYIEADLCML